ILGDTIARIAAEKAGIIKENIPVVVGEYTQETKQVFIEKASQCNAALTFACDIAYNEYASDLKGAYQARNRKTVLATIAELRTAGYVISESAISAGLLHVGANTGLLG